MKYLLISLVFLFSNSIFAECYQPKYSFLEHVQVKKGTFAKDFYRPCKDWIEIRNCITEVEGTRTYIVMLDCAVQSPIRSIPEDEIDKIKEK